MKFEEMQVGMRVKCRTWEDMSKEFPMTGDCGDEILITPDGAGFTSKMKCFCGETGTVVDFKPYEKRVIVKWDNEHRNVESNRFYFEASMFELLVEEESKPPKVHKSKK